MIDVNNKENILKRKKKLEAARVELKNKFVGIDNVIDEFISSVESWFLYPTLRKKPLIVNLWGITGVGKTDLVRSFVKLIDMSDNYCEVQADCTDAYYLKEAIDDAQFDDDIGVVLIDEFQKLKTIDEDHHEIQDNPSCAIDLWSFLSDGSFAVDFGLKSRLRSLIRDFYSDCNSMRSYGESQPKKKNTKDKCEQSKVELTDYQANKLYSILFAANSINGHTLEELKKMTFSQAENMIKGLDKKMEVYENKVFNKVLIVISGNLDEAFHFSSDVFDSDTDADIYNEMSNDIKISNIKKALMARFRPEQIARLGNIHIIYPVLSRAANEELIARSVNNLLERTKKETGFNFVVRKNLLDEIYKNGVYPTQGVRPIFSTISLFVENPISSIMAHLIDTNVEPDTFKELTLDFKDDEIVVTNECGIDIYDYHLSKTLDFISKKKTSNMLTIHSVHEAGHAIIQAILFNVAPRQLISRATQPGVGGFCSVYPFVGTKKQFEDRIACVLAGRAAEKFVFGNEKITLGASSDLRTASDLAFDYVNSYGFSGDLGIYDGRDFFDKGLERDKICEGLLQKAFDVATELLRKNKKYLMDIADIMIDKGEVKSSEFIEISKKYGFDVDIKRFNEDIEDNFEDMYKKFKEE